LIPSAVAGFAGVWKCLCSKIVLCLKRYVRLQLKKRHERN